MKNRFSFLFQCIEDNALSTRFVSAMFFLCLLTTSFIIEGNFLTDGKIFEISENSEKEVEKKEKKLFQLSNDNGHITSQFFQSTGSDFELSLLFAQVHLDIHTPPPQLH